jgi:hypothetical protein
VVNECRQCSRSVRGKCSIYSLKSSSDICVRIVEDKRILQQALLTENVPHRYGSILRSRENNAAPQIILYEKNEVVSAYRGIEGCVSSTKHRSSAAGIKRSNWPLNESQTFSRVLVDFLRLSCVHVLSALEKIMEQEAYLSWFSNTLQRDYPSVVTRPRYAIHLSNNLCVFAQCTLPR